MEEEEDIETGNPQGIDHLIRRDLRNRITNRKAELAGSSHSSSEEERSTESSPDPENISTHPLPRETSTQYEECK